MSTTGVKIKSQEENLARFPFVDCTNSFGLPDKNEDKTWNFGKKGQWKRRARMQSNDTAEGMNSQPDQKGDEQMKRNIVGTEENSLENCVWKKTKSSDIEAVQLISEVEETRRYWSQLCQ